MTPSGRGRHSQASPGTTSQLQRFLFVRGASPSANVNSCLHSCGAAHIAVRSVEGLPSHLLPYFEIGTIIRALGLLRPTIPWARYLMLVGIAFGGCFVALVSQASSPDYRALWWFCLPCACAILVASLGYGLLVKAPVRWVSVEVVCSHPGSVLEGNQVANLQPIHTRRFLDQAQRRRRSTSLVVLHR